MRWREAARAASATAALILFASCASEGATSSEVRAASTRAPVDCHGKPEAPVAVDVTALPGERGRYRVTATATPTVDVDQLAIELLPSRELELTGSRRIIHGPTGAGVSRTASFEIRLTGPGATIEVSGRVWVADLAPSKVARLIVGAPDRTAPPVRVVVLPSGDAIDEVGP